MDIVVILYFLWISSYLAASISTFELFLLFNIITVFVAASGIEVQVNLNI